MKKLVLLAIVSVLAMMLYSCKQEPKENNETKEECAKEICPVHDAVTILESKNSIANLIKEAIADNEISDEEATKINDAFCEYQSVDAEIRLARRLSKQRFARNKKGWEIQPFLLIMLF